MGVKNKKGGAIVTCDRRRVKGERRSPAKIAVQAATPPAGIPERRAKVSRRRQIDPTTCERDYNTDEVEFMNALDLYKRKNGRMFPTCSEMLEVIRSLGYAKLSCDNQLATTTDFEAAPLLVPTLATSN